MKHSIYTDEGDKNGNLTRLFRNTDYGTVEWMFEVDFSWPGRWYAFGLGKTSIEQMQEMGQHLLPYEPPTNTGKPTF